MCQSAYVYSEWPDVDNKAREVFLNDFLNTEIFSEDARQAILEFINNWNIRAGEYECNIYVIHKLDRKTFLIYADEQWGELGEDEMRNRCVARAFSMTKEHLIQVITAYRIIE